MKTIVVFLMSLVTLASCNCTKQTMDKNLTADADKLQKTIPVLKYEETTRGFARKISIENGVATIFSRKLRAGEEQKTVKISDKDLAELTKLYQKIDLEGMANLESPSQKRFHDGAPIANFIVVVGDNTYTSTAFDGGNPPAEIADIVKKLIEITAEKQ